jgi:signal transduction histidine kinase/ligand-binding sensor domain-containing protein
MRKNYFSSLLILSKNRVFSSIALLSILFLLTIFDLLNLTALSQNLKPLIKPQNKTDSPNNLKNKNNDLNKVQPLQGGSLAFHAFTDKDGLPQNSAMAIVFDQKGYLWIGTQDGAAFYNGHKWNTVNMPESKVSNSISAILASKDGSLWFGTNGGGLVQLKEDKWTIHNKKSGALNSNIVKTIIEVSLPSEKQIIWVGTQNGLSSFENGKWATYNVKNSSLPNDDIEALTINQSTNNSYTLWIGTHGGGLVKFENNLWKIYDTTNSPLTNDTIKSLLSTTYKNKHKLWIGTELGLNVLTEDLLTSNSSNNSEWITYNVNNSQLPHNIVRSIYPASFQTNISAVWLATPNGLAYLDQSKENDTFWRIYNSRNSDLPADFIVSLLGVYPSNGKPMLWIGTNGGGIIRANLSGWQTFSNKTSPLPNNIVRYLIEIAENDKHQLWIATYEGLTCLEEGKWTTFNTANSLLPDNNIDTLFQTTSETGEPILWVGTWGGLVRIENGKWTVFNKDNSGLPENRVMSIFEIATIDNKPATLLVGTTGGLACFENGKWFTYTPQNSLLPHKQIDVILETTSTNLRTIWLGTWGGGLVKLEKKPSISLSVDAHNLTESYSWTIYNAENSPLPNNLIKTLKVTSLESAEITANNKKLLWIGTNGGLVCLPLDQENPKWEIFSDSSTPALPNNIVSQIIFTPKKEVFVFTFKGIAFFRPNKENQKFQEIANFDKYVFTTSDGLPGNGINPRAAILDHQNRLWVGTLYGLATLDLHKLTEDRQIKPLVLERVLVDEKPFYKKTSDNRNSTNSLPTLRSDIPQNDIFKYYENRLTFEYALLSYFKESETRYSVQLVGLDAKASDWTVEHKKEYTNLSPNTYQFKVWAKDQQGNISGPVIASFEITPPFWRTWLAILFYLASASGAIYGIVAWRIHTITQKQKEHLAQIRERQEQRIENLKQMLKSIQIINSQLDLETLLQNIAAESARLIDGEPGSIGLVEGGKILFKHLWFEGRLEECNLIFPFGKGVAGLVASTAKPYIVNDIENDENMMFRDMAKKYSPNGFIEIPIIDRSGKVVGVLDVRRSKNRAEFSDVDVQLLQAFAHQAAVAIENASLYGTLEEKNLALEEKNLIIAESLKEIESLYQNEQAVTKTLQELNQMKTNFMVVTSHEMRTPLTILKGNHEALNTKTLGTLTPRQEKSLLACQRAIDRMVESVENISEALKISERQIKLKYVEVNLSSLIVKVINKVEEFIKQRSHNLILDLPEKLIISVDVEKLQLIILNIIQNAIKFTPDGGKISISLVKEGDKAHIIIIDEGIGIEAKDLNRIFDQFYTHSDTLHHTSGKYQFSARGSGLGLSIAKGYVEAHKGEIWAESLGINHGSSFHIVLPLFQK